ncbi:MAG: NAD(P)/FAD-dependent oxidoreductase [Bacteroidota bacterium]|nr:NAD(P)/FAD-dependent oxidoreductase [Ferruginibacter sp.]
MKIIIIGGGFAGINLAKALGNNKNFEVTLVDKNNYYFFPPLIYQVATAFLEPSSISYPFRKLFASRSNVSFRLGELQQIVPSENKIILNNGECSYDVLVVSTGAETNYFGMENVRQNAIPMKTLSDALAMRNRLLEQMEQATIMSDPALIKSLLTVVIAGGGPTGVEVAGMLAEMKSGIFRKEYPKLTGTGGEIILVDGSPAVLGPMSTQSQQDTYDALSKLGVKIILNTNVKDFAGDVVTLSTGETITSRNLIWAAGVTAKSFEGIPAESYGRGKRLLVNEYNAVKGFENIYALGDTSYQLTDPNFPNGHPQVAQVAIQQGKNLARNLEAAIDGKALKPFLYNDKGSMAIIGKNKAVVDLPKPKLHFRGFFAWLIWLFIHLMSLVSFRNKLRTFYNWVVAYFSKDQSLRMIIRPAPRKSLP